MRASCSLTCVTRTTSYPASTAARASPARCDQKYQSSVTRKRSFARGAGGVVSIVVKRGVVKRGPVPRRSLAGGPARVRQGASPCYPRAQAEPRIPTMTRTIRQSTVIGALAIADPANPDTGRRINLGYSLVDVPGDAPRADQHPAHGAANALLLFRLPAQLGHESPGRIVGGCRDRMSWHVDAYGRRASR